MPYVPFMEQAYAYHQRKRSAPRRDGLSTRGVVLEAAGRVFAERGYTRATSREICEKAGVNSAAINYYFGSKEGLYEEVLVEAHRQLVSREDLDAVMDSGGAPADKLRAFIELAVRAALKAPELWGIPVLLRQYLKLNGKILSFSVDKHFGDVLDCLILVDIYKSPERSIKRYMGKDTYEQLLPYMQREREEEKAAE